MPTFNDLTGQVFGGLTVLKRSPSAKGRHSRWLCLCKCGKKKIIQGNSLRSGVTKSCGCRQGRSALPRIICDDGEMRTLSQVSDSTGVSYSLLWNRLNENPDISYDDLVQKRNTRGSKYNIVCDDGETRTLKQVAEHTGISYSTLYTRLMNNPGVSYHELVRELNIRIPKNTIICGDGEARTLKQVAEHTGISYSTLYTKLKNNPGASYQELVRKPNTRVPKNTITIICGDGEARTLEQIAERTGISYSTLMYRLRNNPNITYWELVRKLYSRIEKQNDKQSGK